MIDIRLTEKARNVEIPEAAARYERGEITKGELKRLVAEACEVRVHRNAEREVFDHARTPAMVEIEPAAALCLILAGNRLAAPRSRNIVRVLPSEPTK